MATPPPSTWQWIGRVLWALAKIIGLPRIVNWALGRIDDLVHRQGNRRKAIKAARGVSGGGWAPVLIGEELHYVVFREGEAVQAFPAAESLAEKVEHFNREQIRSPDDVPSKRFRRGAAERLKTAFERIRPGKGEQTDVSLGEGRKVFQELVGGLAPLLEALVAAPAAPVAEHESVPRSAGIYLFSENGAPLYVGQSRNLRTRLRQHTSAKSAENQASFAYNIALKAAAEQGVESKATRKANAADPHFAELFQEARERVANMDVRFLALEGPVERTMLEIYVAQVLDLSEYNSFETH